MAARSPGWRRAIRPDAERRGIIRQGRRFMAVSPDTRHRTGAVRSGDVNLFYRVFGKPGATPVLIFHGANYYDSADWIEVGAALASDREVAAWDARGFGKTGASPSKDYSLDTHMADIVALLDHLGWRKVIAMGHSMGGGRSILFSSRFPDRVAGLVIVDHCPGRGGGAPGAKQSVGNKPPVFATIEAAQKEMSRDTNTPAGSPARARLAEILAPVAGGYTFPRDPDYMNPVPVGGEGGKPKIVVDDMWRELAEVRRPILLVRGTLSDRYDEASLARVAREFPEIRRVDVACGHDVAGGAPRELVAAVREFVKAI
jgi:pimeloyl-ACP methyl ester carboxylesterase